MLIIIIDILNNNSTMESTQVAKRFEVKKWNAVALWAWGRHCIYISE
jgi:hypothetical protein